MIVQAIGDKNSAVRQKRHILRPSEMSLVCSRDALLAESLEQLAAIIGEHVDLMEGLVDDPHTAFRIVGTDAQSVGTGSIRSFAQVVPLVPHLDDLTVTIDGIETVTPDAATGVAEHVDPDGTGISREFWRNRVRQDGFPTLGDEDAVRRFCEHARVAAKRVTCFRKRLMPA